MTGGQITVIEKMLIAENGEKRLNFGFQAKGYIMLIIGTQTNMTKLMLDKTLIVLPNIYYN